MRPSKMLRSRLGRLSLALSLLMLFGGCAHLDGASARRCPEPNPIEEADYASVVAHAPDRPAVRWMARVIGYCWPEEAEAARSEE